ncbi:TPA: MFS transporter, partial [Klebsiella pneumoniae]|nr:MFS transporter [Klebsiella pneumoniae]
ILCGCVVRISGYLLLAISASLWGVILGACLTGIGGALFSPAIESLMAQAGTQSEREGKRSRSEWFALFSVCGELGSVIGPLLGALLTGYSFQSVALGGAGVFLFALIMLYFMLPTGTSHHGTLKISPWWTAFHQRRFVAFIVAYSAYLFSYNQLYLALPVELRRSGGSEAELGPLFMLASVMIIFLQLPLARFARKRGASQ